MTDHIGKPEIDYRVSLSNSTNPTELVIFSTTPDLIETRNVNYKNVDLTHSPGQILAYGNTASRNFNLSNIKLISRTSKEAALNLRRIWMLRSWTMPTFGKSTLSDPQRQNRDQFLADASSVDINSTDFGVEERGSPPAVLLLSAYSNNKRFGQSDGHINRVPVVITNMSIPYPSDVDYIPAEGSGTPMPSILTIDMTLQETHSPIEYETFSLSDFKAGKLKGF